MIRTPKRGLLLDFPLFTAIFATSLSVFITESSVLRSTGGIFVYPLDDPFIHMQLAKNLAFHHTWGINPSEFASASSSLLYTLLLSLFFKFFSAHVYIPLIINCVAGFFLLELVNRWMRKQDVKSYARTCILLLLVFFVPLPAMIVSGMEHTLQCLFGFLFIETFSRWLDESSNGLAKRSLPWRLIVYAFLVTALRYEGIFLIAIASLLLLYHKRVSNTLLLVLAGLSPILLFGIFSLIQGSYFFPNSVLIKSEPISLSLKGIGDFINNLLIAKLTTVKSQGQSPGMPPPGISLLSTQRILIILPLLYFLFRENLRQKKSFVYYILLLLGTAILHLSFAATGWFYRYEAYLVTSTLVITAVVIYKSGHSFTKEKTMVSFLLGIILLFATFFPFVLRSAAAFSKTYQACMNIYGQQYQMASFLRKYYNTDTVAANDIGVISYYTQSEIIDLWGLGNIEIAKSKRNNRYTPAFLDSFVRQKHARVAIVYDSWFNRDVLGHWVKVAEWKIQNNVILGGDVVSFYAIKKDEAAQLRRNLQQFQPSLPETVSVTYTN